jgi:hypothetical protein
LTRSIALVVLLGCRSEVTGIPSGPGNPLVPDVDLLPFPSDLYLVDDATTATGRRLVLPDDVMPGDLVGAEFSGADGYSRITPIVAWWPGGFDPTALPATPDATLELSSPVLLLREGDFEPVPTLVELDLRADGPDEQALLIRPLQALDPAIGYVVILTDALHTADGARPTRSLASTALLEERRSDSPEVEAMREDFALVHAAVDQHGLDVDRIVLAWTFHTRSREDVTSIPLAMHDAAARQEPDVTFTSDVVRDGNRVVNGTFAVPWFLDDEDRVVVSGGVPVADGTRDLPFQVTVPMALPPGSPVFVFGHGFFASLEEPEWSLLSGSLTEWGIGAVTTNFIGFDEEHQVETFGRIGGNLGDVAAVIDQQVQSHAAFTALARVTREALGDEIQVGGEPMLDATVLPYMGISNGGTQGAPLCAASPMFDRCGIVVGGAGWSHLVQRAVQFDTLGAILADELSDDREMQVALGLTQLHFDAVDAANWVDLFDARPDGRSGVRVAMFESVADSQVSNLTTEMMARSADAELVVPSPRDIWGLPTTSSPTDALVSLLVFEDPNAAPSPVGNVSPDEDNGAHEEIRRMPSYVASMGAFLLDGVVGQDCDGPCDPD